MQSMTLSGLFPDDVILQKAGKCLNTMCNPEWVLSLHSQSTLYPNFQNPQRARNCPLQEHQESPNSSCKKFTSSVSRLSRGYKCNNISNLAHRLTCKCALSRPCNLPLEFRAISLCSYECWLRYWLYSSEFPGRPRRLCYSITASTASKTSL